jgi:hypothetical protein
VANGVSETAEFAACIYVIPAAAFAGTVGLINTIAKVPSSKLEFLLNIYLDLLSSFSEEVGSI